MQFACHICEDKGQWGSFGSHPMCEVCLTVFLDKVERKEIPNGSKGIAQLKKSYVKVGRKHAKKKVKINYKEYIDSQEWREKRALLIGNQCFCCWSNENLRLHHLSYEKLGNEPPEHLVTVCCRCHEWIHHYVKTEGWNLRTAHETLRKHPEHKENDRQATPFCTCCRSRENVADIRVGQNFVRECWICRKGIKYMVEKGGWKPETAHLTMREYINAHKGKRPNEVLRGKRLDK